MNEKTRKIELVPYTPMWQEYYLKECRTLEKILRNNVINIYHIGSTAIPAICAKPTLDILCVVHTLDGITAFADEFEKLGLKSLGESGIAERLFFIRLAEDGIKHLSHIHIFKKGNPLINDHLDFKDYLNAQSEVAHEYEKLKISLKNQYSQQPELYTQGKNEFIQTVLKNLKGE